MEAAASPSVGTRSIVNQMIATHRLIAPLAALLFLAAPVAEAAPKRAAAEDWRAPLSCPLKTKGWITEEFPGRAANTLTCRKGALRIASRRSISLHAIRPPIAFQRARRLAWDWRVRTAAGPSDLARKGADDRSIAVLVAFRYNRDTASFAERLLRPMVESRKGSNAPGRVLAYTWVENRKGAPRGILKSPFGGSAHRIIPMRRALGSWRGETVDLAADHRRAFGRGSFEVQYIAIAADTDDLGGKADAMIRNLRLGL